MKGIHNSQTKLELINRLESIARLIGCHPDVIYSKVMDVGGVFAEPSDDQKRLLADNPHFVILETLPDGDLLIGDKTPVHDGDRPEAYGPYIMARDGKIQNVYWHYAKYHGVKELGEV